MTKPIPEGMHSVIPSLTIDGAAEAIEFYKKSFGAEEIARAMDPAGKKIMHAALRINGSTIFLNDVMPGMAEANKSRIWLYLDKVDQAWKRATDAGGQVKMPLADQFWGDRMGVIADRWGNEWTLAQHTKDLSPAEMKQAADAFFASAKPNKA
jgi:uncharacterized glyoxalase superfamily protein PhnB